MTIYLVVGAIIGALIGACAWLYIYVRKTEAKFVCDPPERQREYRIAWAALRFIALRRRKAAQNNQGRKKAAPHLTRGFNEIAIASSDLESTEELREVFARVTDAGFMLPPVLERDWQHDVLSFFKQPREPKTDHDWLMDYAEWLHVQPGYSPPAIKYVQR